MPIVTISTKGRIVIPAEIRKKLSMRAGTKVYLNVDGQNITIMPIPDDPIQAACGFLSGGQSLSKNLEKFRKEEAACRRINR